MSLSFCDLCQEQYELGQIKESERGLAETEVSVRYTGEPEDENYTVCDSCAMEFEDRKDEPDVVFLFVSGRTLKELLQS